MNGIEGITMGSASVDQASDWIAKLDRGLTPREEVRFKAWVFESDENYSTFMTMARLWDRMDALSRLADVCPQATGTVSWWRRHALAAAATVALAAFLGVWGMQQYSGSDAPRNAVTAQTDAYETGIGEHASFSLSDGSTLALNTNSRVSLRYTNSNRLLRLERGEMHIQVAKDVSRPLSVMVGDRVAQAVGTEFNVEITDDNRIELVVTEGIVVVGVVDARSSERDTDTPLALEASSMVVAAGQEVKIDSAAEPSRKIEPKPLNADEIAVKLSWREGNLIFRGESLEEAISEVNRYTTVKFVFLDEESKKVAVAGLFKAGDVEGLLTTLRQNFNVSYERVAEDRIALRSGDSSE